MKIQVLRLITLVSIFLSGLWSVAAFGAPAQGAPIVIGVLEDRSSTGAFFSQESTKALRVFVDAVNNGELLYANQMFKGVPGIMGRPIKLVH